MLDARNIPEWAKPNIERFMVTGKLLDVSQTHFLTQDGAGTNSYSKQFYRLPGAEIQSEGMRMEGPGTTTVLDMMGLQKLIDKLDCCLTATVERPEWFKTPKETGIQIEEEIMQLECEQIVLLDNAKSFRSGKLEVRHNGNLITPSIDAWTENGKEESL